MNNTTENIKDFLNEKISRIKNDINIDIIYARAKEGCLDDSVKKTMDIWDDAVDYRASMIVLSIIKELELGNKAMLDDITDRYIALLNKAGICTKGAGKCNCTCDKQGGKKWLTG